jgi:hypothetical protein
MLVCERCGCDDDRACMTEHGPCHWVSTHPPICSACAAYGLADAAGPEDEDGISLCPASSTPAPHQLVWTSETACHCVRCRTRFAA